MKDLCGEINKFGKGIGNATRYRILEALIKGRKTVGELVGIVKLSQPAVSQHLKTLKSSGLVVDERRGQEVFYAVNTEHMLFLLKSMSVSMQKGQKNKSI
ncbi:MAG TPA: metalloregulator ArsR/SmtB family transcription factor [Candidatus Paceibacterota bacterium]|jgi:ArsR family transcriptional regulator|nr:metalloregulator ArsR/SmtB family transcription factor [Candidatus Paceibacterota bacterium]